MSQFLQIWTRSPIWTWFSNMSFTTTVNEAEEVTEVEKSKLLKQSASEEVTTATADLTTKPSNSRWTNGSSWRPFYQLRKLQLQQRLRKNHRSSVKVQKFLRQRRSCWRDTIYRNTCSWRNSRNNQQQPVATTTNPVEEAPQAATQLPKNGSNDSSGTPVAAAPATERPADTTGTSATEDNKFWHYNFDLSSSKSQTPSRTSLLQRLLTMQDLL